MKNLFFYSLVLFVVLSSCNDDESIVVPISNGAVLDIAVGGETQPNQVFVDLSGDNQSSINRASWDLGFSTGDNYSVILNASSEVMARNLGKSDFSEIETDDYVAFVELMTFDAIFAALMGPPPPWLFESSLWIDDASGDLTQTAINTISDSESSNNIYLINRGFDPNGNSRGSALLVKITRVGTSYQVEYKEPNQSETNTINIEKDPEYNFVHLDFDNGIVHVEPESEKWDIAFTTYMERFDAGGFAVPFSFNDYVIQNRSSVATALVLIEDGSDLLSSYEAFSLGDVNELTFSSASNTIGGGWRTVAGSQGMNTGIKEDRFYVIKDPAGNTYKLLFTAMLNSTGERGFPQISYELLQ